MDQQLKDLKQSIKADHGESWKYWEPICALIQRVHDLEIELNDERELNRPAQELCAEQAKMYAEEERRLCERNAALRDEIRTELKELGRVKYCDVVLLRQAELDNMRKEFEELKQRRADNE